MDYLWKYCVEARVPVRLQYLSYSNLNLGRAHFGPSRPLGWDVTQIKLTVLMCINWPSFFSEQSDVALLLDKLAVMLCRCPVRLDWTIEICHPVQNKPFPTRPGWNVRPRCWSRCLFSSSFEGEKKATCRYHCLLLMAPLLQTNSDILFDSSCSHCLMHMYLGKNSKHIITSLNVGC